MALPQKGDESPGEDASVDVVLSHRENKSRHYMEIEKVKNFGKASQKM